MTIRLRISQKGGSGSGNWGHAGRPGKEGGSLPQGKSAIGTYAVTHKPKRAIARPAGSVSTPENTPGLPRLSIPVGNLPEHQKGDRDGKLAYQNWYASSQTKPSLGDALAMRRYFAERAMQAEQTLAQQGAQEREQSRQQRAEEAANKPKVLTPAEKKKQEAAAKKAASEAAKAKKKAESEAAKKKKAEEAAAKKAAAAEKKGSAADKRAAAQEKKIREAQEKLQAKLASQLQVAESIGMSEEGWNMFKNAVSTLKAGGTLDDGIAEALAGMGLVKPSGDTYTVPTAAMTLMNAIMASDAIRARAALEKLGNKEIGQVRMRKVTRFIIGGGS